MILSKTVNNKKGIGTFHHSDLDNFFSKMIPTFWQLLITPIFLLAILKEWGREIRKIFA